MELTGSDGHCIISSFITLMHLATMYRPTEYSKKICVTLLKVLKLHSIAFLLWLSVDFSISSNYTKLKTKYRINLYLRKQKNDHNHSANTSRSIFLLMHLHVN